MSYVRLAIAAGALLALIGAFMFGRSTGIDRERAAQAKLNARMAAVMNAASAAMDRQAGQLAEARNRQSTETRTIRETATRIIDRPVYRNLCIDADGSRLLDRAAANANRSLAGEPAGGAARTAADAPQP